MTSKIVVNNIESDAGVSTVFFNSDIGGTGGTLNVDGNLNVDGVLSYEDVTNIDSVGLVTARNGLHVTGRIGIDNTTPHRQLVVGDGGDISCFGTNGGIYFGTSTGGFRNNGAIARAAQAGYHVSGSQVGDLVMAPEADKDLIISSGSTNTMYERIRVTTGGNIGINDSGPNFRLDVNGSVALREGQIITWHDGSGNKAGDIYMDSSDSFVIRNTSSVTERLRIDNAGRVTISGQGLKLNTNNSSLYSLDGSLSYYATNNGVYLNGAGTNGWLRLNASGAENNQNAINIFGSSNATSNKITMRTGNSDRFIITNDGHVLHGVTSDEDTSGNGGLRFINSGDIQIDGDQKALVFRSTNNTAQLQSAIEWWNENGAGVQSKISCDRTAVSQAPSDLVFYTSPNVDTGGTSSDGDIAERLRITSAGALLHKGNNSSTIDNTDGDSQASSGYPAGGATFNKNVSVNNNAGSFGQCMNMISHTKSITLNGSTNHPMVTIFNREGCFIGHVYAGYSTSGDGAVTMYKFHTFYGASYLTAEISPQSRSSDTISVSVDSVGDAHTFRVNGNGYSGDVTVGLVFLSAGVAGSAAHYGVRYY